MTDAAAEPGLRPLTEVEVGALRAERFRTVLTTAQMEEFEHTIRRGRAVLEGRVVWSVNSTARGGGVAEMLRSLIAYARGAGVDARWVVIDGEPSFFRITKRIHNRLHGSVGDGGPLGEDERARYEHVCGIYAEELAGRMRPGDVVLLHDPQTAAMAAPLKAAGAHVVWRAHIGLDLPNDTARSAWGFLLPYVTEADAYVFSRRAFAWEGLEAARVVVIPPSIDAFSPKNQALAPETVDAILATIGLSDEAPAGQPTFERHDGTPGRVDRRAEVTEEVPLPAGAPLVAQVSRWDRLKDPIGVMEAFAAGVAPWSDAHLVLAGPDVTAVTDDPEGAEVLSEAEARHAQFVAPVRERIHLARLPMDDADENAAMVNALQRRATVVVQKSLAEGFGLTVAEAMWKGRPVVASRVGGIQDQIDDGVTGELVDPEDLEEAARAMLSLLNDPELAARVGRQAQERVRDSFLGARHLRQYVDLCEMLIRAGEGEGAAA